MKPTVLNLSLETDCPLIPADLPAQRLIEIGITARENALRTERLPINVALVLDRSGSMAGGKLQYVKEAACHVLDQLTERDRVALVAYDDEVRLLSPGLPLTLTERSRLKAQIQELREGGSTDLCGGWLCGANQVASHLLSEGVNRALLLTDGLANRGITDVPTLTRHARELRLRGVSTSTFGVGLDFDHHLLEAMAVEGGGHFYYIEHPGQIPAIFRRELGELLTVVAREAALKLTLPAGVAVTLLGDLPHEQEHGRLRLFLGDLFAQEERRFYFQLLTPPGPQGNPLSLDVELGYVEGSGTFQSSRAQVLFTWADRQAVQSGPQNQPLRERAASVSMSTAESRALKLEREGRRQEAAAEVRKALATNAPVLGAPAAAGYRDLAQRIEQEGLAESERKERHQDAYRKRNTRS